MPRNRTIYNSQALYVSTVSATGMQVQEGSINQLSRIQNFDEDFTRNFTDVNQYGGLSAIDRIEVENPDLTASFSYYITNGQNEKNLGFNVYGTGTNQTDLRSCISGLLTKQTDEKNYYLSIVEEGNDAAGYIGNQGIIGIGNGFLTSYSVNAAVGEIPTADVEIEGLNIRVYSNTSKTFTNWQQIQKITPPGLTFSRPGFGTSVSANSDGTLFVVGAPETQDGAINFYIKSGDKFAFLTGTDFQWATTDSFGTNVYDIGGYFSFGKSVAINNDSNTAVIGGYLPNVSGALAIFTGNNTNWKLNKLIGGYSDIKPFNVNNSQSDIIRDFGKSVAINNSGNIITAGASGAIYILTRTGLNWTVSKNFITGSASFGDSIAINDSGTVIVAGDPTSNSYGGGIRIFTGNNNNWALAQTTGFRGITRQAGTSVSTNSDGSIIAVGAPAALITSFTGQVDIYTGNSQSLWTYSRTINGISPDDLFGRSVSINDDGSIIVIGSNYGETTINNAGVGHIYSGNVTNGWNLIETFGGDTFADGFGTSISTATSKNANLVIIGGPGDDDGGSNAGAVIVATKNDGYPIPAINPSNGQSIADKYFNIPSATSVTGDNIAAALQPGDIIFNVPTSGTLGFSEIDLKVQSFTLSFDLARTPLQKLGNRFAFSREIDFPVTASLEVTAEVGDLRDDNLTNLLCGEEEKEFNILMKKPGCDINKGTALAYIFKGAKLISQSFSSSIGDNATMTSSYEVQLGGPQDVNKGIFISGSF